MAWLMRKPLAKEGSLRPLDNRLPLCTILLTNWSCNGRGEWASAPIGPLTPDTASRILLPATYVAEHGSSGHV